MRDELLQKIEAELHQPIDSERQVVYILVEIRKLLYRNQVPKTDCPHLRMLCDWAVHVDLDRDIVKEHMLILNGIADRLRSNTMTAEDTARSSRVFDLVEARNEFLDFLRKWHLSRRLPDVYGPLWWANFLRYYVRVVADCPLVLKAEQTKKSKNKTRSQNAVGNLKKINSAAMKGYKIVEPGPHEEHLEMSLHIYWEIEFSDGFRTQLVMPLVIEKEQRFFGRADNK
jgi:hypothetical protein